MADNECRRCRQPTYECPVCHGEKDVWGGVSRMPCTECGETGRLCPTDGKFWT